MTVALWWWQGVKTSFLRSDIINTLKIEALLAQKYGYRPLPDDLSGKYRNFFTENIPDFLNIYGDTKTLYTLKHTPVCNGYDRIVVGDYGAFIEFSEDAIASDFVIENGQEYRVNDKKYSKSVKYVWLTTKDGSHIKIYLQKRKVTYADYRPHKYYIRVHEVTLAKERKDT